MAVLLKNGIDYNILLADSFRDGKTNVAACGIIMRGDKVLLIKRVKGGERGSEWEIPGGKVEKGESLKEGVIREVREETNLTVTDITKYVGKADYTFPGSKIEFRLFMFTVNVENTAVRLRPDEHEEYLWVRMNEAKKYLHPDVFTDLFLSYIDSLKVF
ncbi:MAG: NUDIX hydrolase [Candidatus Micrarchaeales archaeon]